MLKRKPNPFAGANLASGASLNTLGNEIKRPPITLPKIRLPDVAEDHAERFQEFRTIKLGRDAWGAITKTESFSAWCRIGAALSYGKQWVLRTSGANCAWGSTYSKAFNKWMADNGFLSMRASDRSYAIALHENRDAITAWRDALPERQRVG